MIFLTMKCCSSTAFFRCFCSRHLIGARERQCLIGWFLLKVYSFKRAESVFGFFSQKLGMEINLTKATIKVSWAVTCLNKYQIIHVHQIHLRSFLMNLQIEFTHLLGHLGATLDSRWFTTFFLFCADTGLGTSCWVEG